MRKGLTDEEVELEIEWLKNSEEVKLARLDQRADKGYQNKA